MVYLSDSNSPCSSIWTTCLLRRLLRTSEVGFHNVSCCPDCFSYMNTSLSWTEQWSVKSHDAKPPKDTRSNLLCQTLRPSLKRVVFSQQTSGNYSEHWEWSSQQFQQASVGTKTIKVLTQCPSTVAKSSSPIKIFPLIWFTEQAPPRKGCKGWREGHRLHHMSSTQVIA